MRAGRCCEVTAGTSLEHLCQAVGSSDRNSGESQVRVGADVPSVREETGCSFGLCSPSPRLLTLTMGERRNWLLLWVVQPKVVGCAGV